MVDITGALLESATGPRIRRKARRGQFAALLGGSLIALWLGLASRADAEWVGQAMDLMGTRVSVELWDEDETEGSALVERVLDEYRRIDRDLSTYRPDSEISHVNAEAGMHPVEIGDELYRLIDASLDLSRASGGAFDISYESVGYMYDFRAHVHPDEAEIAAAIGGVDYRHILLDGEKRTVQFAAPGMRINLGGIAKGYTVELGAKILRAAGIEHALLNAGGDTRVLGDRLGEPWVIGIRHPRLENAYATKLPLVDEAISTSGDYERFFEEDGKRYHHILNPRTGEPTTGLISATVIGPDAMITDGLSTTVFVLGPEKGLELIERYPGYEAIVVEPTGHMSYSSGLVTPGD